MAEGRKDDTGKLRFDLIPPRPLELIAEVYTIGAKKYADRNWERGIQYGRLFAAMMRHAWKWWKGEERDAVDGQHHLASVAWCALALMEFQFTHPELDDRPYSSPKDPVKVDLSGSLIPGGMANNKHNPYSPESIRRSQTLYGSPNKQGDTKDVQRSDPKTWINPRGPIA